ncbi:MAG TPA: DUF6048 family protein [Cytophagaceae bacterium]
MLRKASLFIIKLLIANAGYSQTVGITKVRFGLDPIKSATMFFPEKDGLNNRFYFNTWEATAEIAGNYRTSLVLEYGYTKAHLQDYYGNIDYRSKGNYLKVGLDFNITEEDPNMELDLSWRFGVNRFSEAARIKLNGEFYENIRVVNLPQAERSLVWGEILMSYKVRLMKHSHMLNRLWFGTDLRLKFMNSLPQRLGYASMNIPGYGLPNNFCGGAAFKLCYQFDIHHSLMHEIKHKHSNQFSREQYRHNQL